MLLVELVTSPAWIPLMALVGLGAFALGGRRPRKKRKK
jgi:MYXO-CTERM domain-containing protein